MMSEESTSDNITYINGQKVYDEDFIEPLVPPMPKSPIESSMEQTAFLTEQIASAQSSSINLVEQNGFIVQELALTQATSRLLAEQQASILLLLAEQTNPPINENPTETPEETENPNEPSEEESPTDEPNEEKIPEEGDVQ